jgi:amidase
LERDLDSYLKQLPAVVKVHSLKQVIASGKYHPGIDANIKEAVTLDTNSVEYKDRLIRRQNLQTQIVKIMADNRIDAIMFPQQKRLVVPVGFSAPTATAPIGVPVGLELVGRPFAEPTLIRLGYAFEQATRLRKQPVSAPALK